jgi:hypothetical protein
MCTKMSDEIKGHRTYDKYINLPLNFSMGMASLITFSGKVKLKFIFCLFLFCSYHIGMQNVSSPYYMDYIYNAYMNY